MMCEEGSVIAGLLMGLNAIDYNVMMKGEDFDKSVSYTGNWCSGKEGEEGRGRS